MKRLISTILIITFALATSFAKEVSIDTARQAAINFATNNTSLEFDGQADHLEPSITFSSSRGTACLYVFNIGDGFVIVSADDIAMPILGYSEEGNLTSGNIPDALNAYLLHFTEQIQYGIDNGTATNAARIWERVMTDGSISETRNKTVVTPLVSSLWNQDYPYNMLCPEDGDGPGGHVYAGCTATSISQIMHYWRYPLTGSGSHTWHHWYYPPQTANFGETQYDYDNMPNSLGGATAEQKEAVALLQWHAGIALDSNYGPTGTGAYPSEISNVIKTYFRYANDCYGEWRNGWWKGDGISRDEWTERCKNDLDNARPIHYGGWTSEGSGHAFVCDGYDENDMFHFNFGWSGSGNGYYALDAIDVQGYDFSYSNFATFNIHPQGERLHVRTEPNIAYSGEVFGVGSYAPGEVCSLTACPNKNYMFDSWSENGETLSTDSIITFTVNSDRHIIANFSRQDCVITVSANPQEGGIVTGAGTYPFNEEVTLSATPNDGYVFKKWTKNGVKVSSNPIYTFKASTSKDFVAFFDKVNGTDENSARITDIYPNPSTDKIFVEGLNIKEIALFNTIGQLVIKQTNDNLDETVSINIQGLEKGIYYLVINGGITRKVVKD
ncbi:MAG: C10 family peptidase [Candidatus Limimorpha sp.]